MTNNTENEAVRKERLKKLEREAAEHNVRIIPNTTGTVRMEGPRRQYRCEIRGGVKHFIEI